MTYHGPDSARMLHQFTDLQGYVGQTVIWREWLTASASSTSAYLAGAGKVDSWREQHITALIASPGQGVPPSFREAMAPGGQIMAGDMVLSTRQRLGTQDQVVWGGVTYRIEGDSQESRARGILWYRTYVRRGDVTG